MKPELHLISCVYNALYLYLATKLSFRNVSETMNRFLHTTSEHEIKVSTLEGRVESHGKTLPLVYKEKAADILESHNIDTL